MIYRVKGRSMTSATRVSVMRRLIVAVLLLAAAGVVHTSADRDDDFAEFDYDLDDEEGEVAIEEEEEEEDDMEVTEKNEEEGEEVGEFEGLDDDEFEGGQSVPPLNRIEISESAVRVQPLWEAYLGELLIAAGLMLYIVNYITGRSKNSSLAQAWLDQHLELLRSNFSLVGDSGEAKEEGEGGEEEGDTEGDGKLIKESDSTYSIWASGRVHCEGFLAQIKLSKRQDLLSVLFSLFRPQHDSVTLVMQMGDQDMDSIVLAVGQRKTLSTMHKEYEDLNCYCSGPRSGVRLGLHSDLHVVSEVPEVVQTVLTQQMISFLNKRAQHLDSLHISDMYTGYLPDSEDSDVVVVRKTQKRIQLTFKMEDVTKDSDEMVRFALRLLDHVKTCRISREAKDKALRNRSKVAQGREKLQHAQRQEAAQARREEKKRQEKEKMMLEDDPEKTRKWEQREHKKQMRKLLQPKLKSVKMRVT